MKGRSFIEGVRSFRIFAESEDEAMQICHLLADAVEEADGSFRALIESECAWVGDPACDSARFGWWDTSRIGGGVEPAYAADAMPLVQRALSYLDRRGLIKRKEGEPHMVRFVEE